MRAVKYWILYTIINISTPMKLTMTLNIKNYNIYIQLSLPSYVPLQLLSSWSYTKILIFEVNLSSMLPDILQQLPLFQDAPTYKSRPALCLRSESSQNLFLNEMEEILRSDRKEGNIMQCYEEENPIIKAFQERILKYSSL